MPIIKDKDGNVVWKVSVTAGAGPAKHWYDHNPSLGSWDVRGGTVVIRDYKGNVIKARQLRPGETVEGY